MSARSCGDTGRGRRFHLDPTAVHPQQSNQRDLTDVAARDRRGRSLDRGAQFCAGPSRGRGSCEGSLLPAASVRNWTKNPRSAAKAVRCKRRVGVHSDAAAAFGDEQYSSVLVDFEHEFLPNRAGSTARAPRRAVAVSACNSTPIRRANRPPSPRRRRAVQSRLLPRLGVPRQAIRERDRSGRRKTG